MTHETAEVVSNLMLEFGRRLTETLVLVRETTSDPEDVKRFRNAVGLLLTNMLTEVMNPLYQEHPDLKPPELL